MLQLEKVRGTVNEKGCIEIPVSVLEENSIRTGDEVEILYKVEEGQGFEPKEFLLLRDKKKECIESPILEFILKESELNEEDELNITCSHRRIVICPSGKNPNEFIPEEIIALCEELDMLGEQIEDIFYGREKNIDSKKRIYVYENLAGELVE